MWPALAVGQGCRTLSVNDVFRAADADAMAGLVCPRARGMEENGNDCTSNCLLYRARKHLQRRPGTRFYREGDLWVFQLKTGRDDWWLAVLRNDAWRKLSRRGGVEGSSEKAVRLRELIDKIAGYDINVLLQGEVGSGRKLVARAIHEASIHRRGPFVAVDCLTLANPYSDQRVDIEPPQEGTLFLKEVGQMPMPYQMLLAQALEENRGRRVIGSTRQDLMALMREEVVLKELYYDLAMFVIDVPSLRDRPSDIPALARQILSERVSDGPIPLIHPEVFEWMAGYDFPGNLRELRNLLEKARMFQQEGGLITLRSLGVVEGLVGMDIPPAGIPVPEDVVPLKDLERHYLYQITRRYEGSKQHLASRLGVSERTLYRKLRQLRSAEPVE